jgi:hypothetical protein
VLGLSAPNASDGSRIAAVATIIFTIALGNEVKRKRGSAADKIEEQIFIKGWGWVMAYCRPSLQIAPDRGKHLITFLRKYFDSIGQI